MRMGNAAVVLCPKTLHQEHIGNEAFSGPALAKCLPDLESPLERPLTVPRRNRYRR
jgi:hypothetical protein